MLSVQWWRNRLYDDPAARDPAVRFIEVLNQYVTPDSRVLDVGAGAGELNRYQLRGNCKEIVGVDLDPRVTENPLLDRGLVADATRIPCDNESFDVAFSIYVLEHVDSPEEFAAEVGRVLKPGGYFLSLTPNKYHYVPLMASLTPTSFHRWYNRRRGRDGEDTFPTYYRLNSRAALEKCFQPAGLELQALEMIECQPNYLQFSLPSYLCGVAYERLVNASSLLEGLRVNSISVFRKT